MRAAREMVPDYAAPPEEAGVRVAPIEATIEAYNQHKDMYLALQVATAGAETTPPAAGAILISGCMDYQVSLDGMRNGLFTANLKRVWSDGGFEGSYRRFHETIVSRMPPTQTPNLFQVGDVTSAFINGKPFTV